MKFSTILSDEMIIRNIDAQTKVVLSNWMNQIKKFPIQKLPEMKQQEFLNLIKLNLFETIDIFNYTQNMSLNKAKPIWQAYSIIVSIVTKMYMLNFRFSEF